MYINRTFKRQTILLLFAVRGQDEGGSHAHQQIIVVSGASCSGTRRQAPGTRSISSVETHALSQGLDRRQL